MSNPYSDDEIRRQRSEWRERVEALGPILRSQTQAHEQLRQLSDDTVAALREARAFSICSPREVGGADLHPVAQMETFAGIVAHDSAAGWCAMIGSHESCWLASRLPQDGLDAVFADADSHWPVTAGSVAPGGQAATADGGWRVDGRWAWGSGIYHADWVIGHARLTDVEREPGQPPAMLIAAVPQSDVAIEDTWDTLGMRGTGSAHYRFDDLFVPESMALAGFEQPPRRGDGWIARPTVAFLTPGAFGMALGLAERALDELTDLAAGRVRQGQREGIAAQQSFQRELGQAAAAAQAIRGYGEQLFSQLADAPVNSLADSVALDDRSRSAALWATQTSEQIVQFAHRAAGGDAVFADHPLPRLLRDAATIRQHVVVSDSAYERLGRARLGFEVPPGL